jgi:hypothetical protein
MIGSIANQSVFMYLMDIYVYNLRINGPLYFQVSVNEIAYERNMNWRTVDTTIQSLQKMRLISTEGELYTIDGSRFVSLIRAFYNLVEKPKRKLFIKKLSEGDYDELKQLGYKYDKSAYKDLTATKKKYSRFKYSKVYKSKNR